SRSNAPGGRGPPLTPHGQVPWPTPRGRVPSPPLRGQVPRTGLYAGSWHHSLTTQAIAGDAFVPAPGEQADQTDTQPAQDLGLGTAHGARCNSCGIDDCPITAGSQRGGSAAVRAATRARQDRRGEGALETGVSCRQAGKTARRTQRPEERRADETVSREVATSA